MLSIYGSRFVSNRANTRSNTAQNLHMSLSYQSLLTITNKYQNSGLILPGYSSRISIVSRYLSHTSFVRKLNALCFDQLGISFVPTTPILSVPKLVLHVPAVMQTKVGSPVRWLRSSSRAICLSSKLAKFPPKRRLSVVQKRHERGTPLIWPS